MTRAGMERPPLTDEEVQREIDRLGRLNAETLRRRSRTLHPWDEWDLAASPDPEGPSDDVAG